MALSPRADRFIHKYDNRWRRKQRQSAAAIEVPMRYRPSLDDFRALAATHSIVPVYRQLVGDTLTPVTAFRAIQEGDWSFLFESVIGGERLGRYSFLGSGP